MNPIHRSIGAIGGLIEIAAACRRLAPASFLLLQRLKARGVIETDYGDMTTRARAAHRAFVDQG
jgi:hypothetical protein